MIYGYARVSTTTQCLDMQVNTLEKYGCQEILSETVSTRKRTRPQLEKLKSVLKFGDILVCYKLDRLGRSLKELVNLISDFEEKGIRFISIADGIDTATSGSKLLINIMMCIADFEREMIRERTKAGLEAARLRGKKLGRPKGLSANSCKKKREVIALYKKGKKTTEIRKLVNISRPTIYRYLNLEKNSILSLMNLNSEVAKA